jgi:hypothetical protein
MTATLFTLVALTSLVLLYFGTGKNKKLVMLFSAWQLAVGIIAGTGIFVSKPNLFPLLIIVSVALIIYSLKTIDDRALNRSVLLGIHALRIPVEIVLYKLYLEKKVPELMTFSGWNFDIAIGISALLLLLYIVLTKKEMDRKIFMAWNIVGLLFLLFIVDLAILSSPLPIQQFAFDQPNVAIAEFPYCYLPTCVVPIVFISHVLLLRRKTATLMT